MSSIQIEPIRDEYLLLGATPGGIYLVDHLYLGRTSDVFVLKLFDRLHRGKSPESNVNAGFNWGRQHTGLPYGIAMRQCENANEYPGSKWVEID